MRAEARAGALGVQMRMAGDRAAGLARDLRDVGQRHGRKSPTLGSRPGVAVLPLHGVLGTSQILAARAHACLITCVAASLTATPFENAVRPPPVRKV